MSGNSGSVFGRIFLVCFAVFSLLLLIFQLDNLEKKMIGLSSDTEVLSGYLSDLSHRISALERSLAVSRSNPENRPRGRSGRHFRNPDIPNFLIDEQPAKPPAEANYDGVFNKVYNFNGLDPKGLNFILENSSDVSEEIGSYVNLSIAARLPRSPEKYYGLLAERVEITDDFKEFTIYLKEGVKWQLPAVDWSDPRYEWLKGTRYVTTADIKTTLDLILNPQVQASHLRNYYEDIESVELIDEHTMSIRWKKRTYQALSFTLGLFPTPGWLYGYDEDGKPFPPETAGLRFNEHWYNNRAIGCGPYEFVDWEPGVLIRLKRFEDYSGVRPPIREVNYHLIRDKNQQLLNFQSGLLDIHEFSVSQYREKILNTTLESPYKAGLYSVHAITQMVYRYIGWNMEHVLFKDRRVRLAMTHAMNRGGIIRNVLHNLGEPISGPFFPYSGAYDTTITPYPYDLNEARRLLAEAGWQDSDGDGILDREIEGRRVKFEFSLLIYGYRPEVRSWATIFREELYKIGVVCNLQPVEWSVMQQKMDAREFDAYTGGWGLPWESDPYQIWHSSQADQPKSSNIVGFRHEEADRLIENLRKTFNPARRNEIYHRLHRILHEEQPYTFLYVEKSVVVAQPRVKNISFKLLRPHVDFSDWYIEEME
jgi:ABC-type transport system substrate-binding protein